MKKIYYSVFFAALILFAGCENDFDAKIYGSLSTTNFPSSEADYESYMMDCYIPFSVNWTYQWSGSSNQHNFYVTEGGIYRMLDTTTDLCAPWTIGSWGGPWIYMPQGQFEDMQFATRTSTVLPSHFEKVRDISRMTQIIGTLESATVLSEEKKKEFIGEARLLRGMTMYYLMHFYGPVPVILDPEMIGNLEEEKKLERPSLSEMVEAITADFEYAVENMAEKQAEKGRYTADYARFCLMRHYLNEGAHMNGYYKKAYDLYSRFTGGYSLFVTGTNPYADQFKIANKFNSEIIMAVSCSETATGSGSLGNFNPFSWYLVPWDATKYDDKGEPTPFVNQGGGWSQCLNVDPQFYDTFEEGDLRKETILTSYYSSLHKGWVTRDDIGVKWDGFILNKYPIETATSFQGTDFPLARWADVLLMYAEADVRLNNSVSASAIDCVNQVRSRAGLAGLPAEATSSVSAFMDALLTERGHELFYEGGRKVDLIRFNKYHPIMTSFGYEPTSQYFPLPNFAVEQAEAAGYTLTQYFTRDDYEGPKR
ncbi:MAG: RagB/SusD family nutrient uptake outer membrane protein [Tannerella sp.]|jgi:hypothetical protein|nr:RagB/SusD family nutrient uptake outer membrane protein [Tannerella sp.]